MNFEVYKYLSYGIYIITTLDGEKPVGCIANCAMQVTAEPATIVVSINHDNYTHGCIKKNGKFAISILKETSAPSLIGTFGFVSSRDRDKFSKTEYEYQMGIPVVKDACGYLICNVIDQFETLTHTMFLGEVLEGDVFEEPGDAMTYAYYHRELKGSSSKNAPTYRPAEAAQATSVNAVDNKEEKVEAQGTKYRCSVCNYEEYFQGEVPEDFICPICGQGADKMVKVE